MARTMIDFNLVLGQTQDGAQIEISLSVKNEWIVSRRNRLYKLTLLTCLSSWCRCVNDEGNTDVEFILLLR